MDTAQELLPYSKSPRLVRNTKDHCLVHKNPSSVPVLSQINPVQDDCLQDVALPILVESDRRFRNAYCLHNLGNRLDPINHLQIRNRHKLKSH